jgi:hypothetical protein
VRRDHSAGAAAEFGAAGAEEHAVADAVSQLLLRLGEMDDGCQPDRAGDGAALTAGGR